MCIFIFGESPNFGPAATEIQVSAGEFVYIFRAAEWRYLHCLPLGNCLSGLSEVGRMQGLATILQLDLFQVAT